MENQTQVSQVSSLCILIAYCILFFLGGGVGEQLDRTCAPRMDHMCYDQCFRLNPLWIACYGDEDMVGKVKCMAVQAMPRQMSRQVLKRYIAYVGVRWQRQLCGEV